MTEPVPPATVADAKGAFAAVGLSVTLYPVEEPPGDPGAVPARV